MKKDTTGTRQSATRTLLSKIQKRAKSLARNGAGYQSELERLSVEAGYAGGWAELQRAVVDSPYENEIICLSKDMPHLNRMPIWDRSESELRRWYLKPYVAKAGPHNYRLALCLDGRVWNSSSVALWTQTDDFHIDDIDGARDSFVFFLVNSRLSVEKHISIPGAWSLQLYWRFFISFLGEDIECMYFSQSKERVLARAKLLNEIKQQRIKNLNALFSIEELRRS